MAQGLRAPAEEVEVESAQVRVPVVPARKWAREEEGQARAQVKEELPEEVQARRGARGLLSFLVLQGNLQ